MGKKSGTLLGVGTAYLPVKEIKGEFYVKVSDFNRCMDSMRNELEEENKNLKLENTKLKDRIITDENFEEKLDKENKKLREELNKFKNDGLTYAHQSKNVPFAKVYIKKE